ncbi:1556_t:CDS:1, partial [Dentiscutata heterogama]
KKPNCDLNIYNSCNLYFKDLQLSKGEYLDIASDEMIFCCLISYCNLKEDKPI